MLAAAKPGASNPTEDDMGKVVRIRMETDGGGIECSVYPEAAPESAGNFLDHLDRGLFDGAVFFRAVRRDNDNGLPIIEVIQAALSDASVALPPVRHETTRETGIRHLDGTLSLGRTEPGTGSGAEFFITVGDQPSLDFGGTRNKDGRGFAAFGRVTGGMKVVRRIHRMETTGSTDEAYVEGQILTRPVTISKAARIP